MSLPRSSSSLAVVRDVQYLCRARIYSNNLAHILQSEAVANRHTVMLNVL